ncbi:MAG: hypothetical protein J0H69_06490 [Burkholderiales bacterium]|nr:hypothetical protein [Burkholderiales bacterium]
MPLVYLPRLKSLLIAAAIFAAAWYGFWHYIPNYKPAVMKTFSPNLRTHCVGRYLIDLPEDMGEPDVSLAQFYYGLDRNFKTVEASMPQGEAMAFDEFRRRATARLDELKATKNSGLNIPMLLHSEIVPTPNGDALLLRRLESDVGSPSTTVTEIHAYVNDRYIQLRGEAYPPDAMYSQSIRPIYPFADHRSVEDRLKKMVQHLRAAKDPLRAGEGFCMNGIVFDAQRIGYDEEKANFSFRSGDLPNRILFEVSMDGKTGQEEKTLLEQVAEEDVIAQKFEEPGVIFRNIRRGERTIDAMRFQEDGTQLYIRSASAHQFRIAGRNVLERSQLSWARPSMALRLDSGEFGTQEAKSPLDRQQVETAWDQWISSLRLSPANGGATR